MQLLQLFLHPNYLDKATKIIRTELNYLKNNISKLDNFDCYDSVTNFILIKTKLNLHNYNKNY